jgi:hypothetical protein
VAAPALEKGNVLNICVGKENRKSVEIIERIER